MNHDIDGKPLSDESRHTGPVWDPHREYPEPEPCTPCVISLDGVKAEDIESITFQGVPGEQPNGRSALPDMQISLFSRAELLLVALGELKEAEHHLATARSIREDGHDAHSVPYWEREVARLRAKVVGACVLCGGDPRRTAGMTFYRSDVPPSGPVCLACSVRVLADPVECDQCGASGAITVTDAGDFCSCGAEVKR